MTGNKHGLSASSGSWIFPIIAGLYLLHTSQFFLVALYLAWSYLRNQAKLKINDAWFKGDGNGGVTLILQVNFKIPFDFGYYCQIDACDISASYTMIPFDLHAP